MRKITLMAVFVTGLFFIEAAAANAQNGIPPGSYRYSCKNISVAGIELQAQCNPKGDNTWAAKTDPLTDFFLCADDIRNDDGQLKCTKSDDAPLMKKAAAAIAESFQKQYGAPCDCGIMEIRFWVREMFKAKVPNIVNNFYKGLSIVEVGQFMREFIRRPENSGIRLELIKRAFFDVYGATADPSPQDVAFWNAEIVKGGNFYQNIVAGETRKLNAPDNKIIRRATIMFAYKKMMGRNPTKDETAYWEPKTETYRQILAAGRDFLYSPNGAKDLAATVERALSQKSGGQPSVAQINDAILKYAKTKAIFAEM